MLGHLLALAYITLLNTMVVVRYWNYFHALHEHFHEVYFRIFHISGFDPYSYEVLSEWYPDYNIYRHPSRWPSSCGCPHNYARALTC